jgi:hypothetical protein
VTISLGYWILYSGAWCLCVFSVKLPSCHPSGSKNLEVAPRFSGNLCNSAVKLRPF